MKNADMVVVIKDGTIVQHGIHDELVKIPGPYQDIDELQLRPQDLALNGHQNTDSRGDERAPAANTEAPNRKATRDS